jgi:plasmid stability protein
MSDILIRGLAPQTLKRLKTRAKRHGRSLQSEARCVLENAAGQSVAEVLTSARQWRKKLGRRFEDSVRLIREDRER